MLSEKFLSRVNKILEDKTFTFNGNLIYGVPCDLDFKIEFLGYRDMITMGTPLPYLRVKLIITDVRGYVGKLIFSKINEPDRLKELLNNQLLSFKHNITDYIEGVSNVFDSDTNRIIIDKFELDLKNPINITEQKKSRQATRQVVRDIINIVKQKKKGTFYLPDDDLYTFENFPVEFSVELTLKTTNKIKGYEMNANYVPDEDVIEVLIRFNPKGIESDLSNMVGSLNEIITHELEHSLQNYRGELDVDFDSESLEPFEYYSQPHEIQAQVKGFRRISNLRKRP